MKNLLSDNKLISRAESQQRQNEKITVLVMAVCIACLPELALAAATDAGGTIEKVIQSITDLLNGTLARGVAVLFCIGMGFAAWAGKLSWKMAGNFIAGITLIFGAVGFVKLIETGA